MARYNIIGFDKEVYNARDRMYFRAYPKIEIGDSNTYKYAIYMFDDTKGTLCTNTPSYRNAEKFDPKVHESNAPQFGATSPYVYPTGLEVRMPALNFNGNVTIAIVRYRIDSGDASYWYSIENHIRRLAPNFDWEDTHSFFDGKNSLVAVGKTEITWDGSYEPYNTLIIEDSVDELKLRTDNTGISVFSFNYSAAAYEINTGKGVILKGDTSLNPPHINFVGEIPDLEGEVMCVICGTQKPYPLPIEWASIANCCMYFIHQRDLGITAPIVTLVPTYPQAWCRLYIPPKKEIDSGNDIGKEALPCDVLEPSPEPVESKTSEDDEEYAEVYIPDNIGIDKTKTSIWQWIWNFITQFFNRLT